MGEVFVISGGINLLQSAAVAPDGRRDLGTRVQYSIVVSKYLSPKPERHMGRSLQRNIFDRLRTLQGRNPQGAPRPLFSLRIPSSNRVR